MVLSEIPLCDTSWEPRGTFLPAEVGILLHRNTDVRYYSILQCARIDLIEKIREHAQRRSWEQHSQDAHHRLTNMVNDFAIDDWWEIQRQTKSNNNKHVVEVESRGTHLGLDSEPENDELKMNALFTENASVEEVGGIL